MVADLAGQGLNCEGCRGQAKSLWHLEGWEAVKEWPDPRRVPKLGATSQF